MTGRNIRKDAVLESAELVDIAPTILALLDIPPAQDMDGRVLEELFTDGWRAACPDERVPTYDTPEWLAMREGAPVASGVDAALMERLRGLGYIE